MSFERWKCDRNGGFAKGPYMRRLPWTCPSCILSQDLAGHRCQYCRRRVCCGCFHHDEAVCLSAGSDTSVRDAANPVVVPCSQTYLALGGLSDPLDSDDTDLHLPHTY